MSKNKKLIGSNIGGDLKNSPIAMLVNGEWQIYTLDTNSNLKKGGCYSASNSQTGSQHPFYTNSGQTLTIKNSSGTSTDNVSCKDDDKGYGVLNISEGGICAPTELKDDFTYSIKYDGSDLVCSKNNPSESRWYCLPDKKMCQLSTTDQADTSYKKRLECVNSCIPTVTDAKNKNNNVLVFPYPNSDNIDSIKAANLFYNTFLISTKNNIPLSFALAFPNIFPQINSDSAYFGECLKDNYLTLSGNHYVGPCGFSGYSTMDDFNTAYKYFKSKSALETGFLFPEINHSALSIGHTRSKTGDKLSNIYFCPVYIDDSDIVIGYKLYTILDDNNAHKIHYYLNPGSSHIDCEDQVDPFLTTFHYSPPPKTRITFSQSSVFPWTNNLDIFAFTKIDDSNNVELGIMWKMYKAGKVNDFKEVLITCDDPNNSGRKIYFPIFMRPSNDFNNNPVIRLFYGSNGGCNNTICSANVEKHYGTLIDEYTVNINSWGGDDGTMAKILPFVPSSINNSPLIGCRSIVRSDQSN